MKQFTILLFVAFFIATNALSEEQAAKLKAHFEKCTKETGVDVELIQKGRKGDFVKDEKLQKYYFCMFKEIGILNDDGEPQIEVIKSKIPGDVKPEDALKVIEVCQKEKGTDKYETAQKIYECYYKTSPTHITLS